MSRFNIGDRVVVEVPARLSTIGETLRTYEYREGMVGKALYREGDRYLSRHRLEDFEGDGARGFTLVEYIPARSKHGIVIKGVI